MDQDGIELRPREGTRSWEAVHSRRERERERESLCVVFCLGPPPIVLFAVTLLSTLPQLPGFVGFVFGPLDGTLAKV